MDLKHEGKKKWKKTVKKKGNAGLRIAVLILLQERNECQFYTFSPHLTSSVLLHPQFSMTFYNHRII